MGLPISMACSLGLAVLLQPENSLQNLFRLIYFCRRIISGVGIYLLWKWIFNAIRMVNSVIAMVFHTPGPACWSRSLGKNALIIMSVWAAAGRANMVSIWRPCKNVDIELYEAARSMERMAGTNFPILPGNDFADDCIYFHDGTHRGGSKEDLTPLM